MTRCPKCYPTHPGPRVKKRPYKAASKEWAGVAAEWAGAVAWECPVVGIPVAGTQVADTRVVATPEVAVDTQEAVVDILAGNRCLR